MAASTPDKKTPKLVISPKKTGIKVDQDLVFTFDEGVKVGTGYITISNGEDVRKIAITDKQIKVSGKTITINPSKNLLADSHYNVKIDATAIKDLAGNKYAGTTLNFDTVDTKSPTLVSSTPKTGGGNVKTNQDLVLTFNEDLKVGTGYITISNGEDVRKIAITDKQIKVSGKTITINSSKDLLADSHYNVKIDATAIKDLAGNKYAGTTLNFDTVDTKSPTLVSSTPKTGGGNVKTNQDLVLTFNEDIKVGTGNITISNGEDVRTIAITDKQIKVSGKTITINPSKDLLPNSHYGVKIDATAIKDLAGNKFVGITDAKTLAFDTIDTLAPKLVSSTPQNNSSNIQSSTKITLIFNEAIQIGVGSISIIDNSNGSQKIAISDKNLIQIDGSTLTISLNKSLNKNSDYHIEMPAGIIEDFADNKFAGILDNKTLSFHTSSDPDIQPPVLNSMLPANNAKAVSVSSDITLTFSEAIQAGKGNITIFNGVGKQKISITDSEVSIENSTLTISPKVNLLGNNHYNVQLDAGVITDKSGNKGNALTFSFDTQDLQAPVLLSSNPSNASPAIKKNGTISLTFDEDVFAGNGNFVISSTKDTRNIAVTDESQVSISGKTVTIDPKADFTPGEKYNVSFAKGVLTDASKNAHQGLTENQAVTFSIVTGTVSSSSSSSIVYIPVEVSTPPPVYIPVEVPAPLPPPVYVYVDVPTPAPPPVYVPVEVTTPPPPPVYIPVEVPTPAPPPVYISVPVEKIVYVPQPPTPPTPVTRPLLPSEMTQGQYDEFTAKQKAAGKTAVIEMSAAQAIQIPDELARNPKNAHAVNLRDTSEAIDTDFDQLHEKNMDPPIGLVTFTDPKPKLVLTSEQFEKDQEADEQQGLLKFIDPDIDYELTISDLPVSDIDKVMNERLVDKFIVVASVEDIIKNWGKLENALEHGKLVGVTITTNGLGTLVVTDLIKDGSAVGNDSAQWFNGVNQTSLNLLKMIQTPTATTKFNVEIYTDNLSTDMWAALHDVRIANTSIGTMGINLKENGKISAHDLLSLQQSVIDNGGLTGLTIDSSKIDKLSWYLPDLKDVETLSQSAVTIKHGVDIGDNKAISITFNNDYEFDTADISAFVNSSLYENGLTGSGVTFTFTGEFKSVKVADSIENVNSNIGNIIKFSNLFVNKDSGEENVVYLDLAGNNNVLTVSVSQLSESRALINNSYGEVPIEDPYLYDVVTTNESYDASPHSFALIISDSETNFTDLDLSSVPNTDITIKLTGTAGTVGTKNVNLNYGQSLKFDLSSLTGATKITVSGGLYEYISHVEITSSDNKTFGFNLNNVDVSQLTKSSFIDIGSADFEFVMSIYDAFSYLWYHETYDLGTGTYTYLIPENLVIKDTAQNISDYWGDLANFMGNSIKGIVVTDNNVLDVYDLFDVYNENGYPINSDSYFAGLNQSSENFLKKVRYDPTVDVSLGDKRGINVHSSLFGIPSNDTDGKDGADIWQALSGLNLKNPIHFVDESYVLWITPADLSALQSAVKNGVIKDYTFNGSYVVLLAPQDGEIPQPQDWTGFNTDAVYKPTLYLESNWKADQIESLNDLIDLDKFNVDNYFEVYVLDSIEKLTEYFDDLVALKTKLNDAYIQLSVLSGTTGDLPSTTVNDEVANNTKNAGTLDVGNSVISQIEIPNDQDWFKILLDAGKTYKIDLEGTEKSGYTYLYDTYLYGIYDKNGNSLGYSNDDSNGTVSSEVIFTPTETANYFISAGAYGSGTGSYKLSAVMVELGVVEINASQLKENSADILNAINSAYQLVVNFSEVDNVNLSTLNSVNVTKITFKPADSQALNKTITLNSAQNISIDLSGLNLTVVTESVSADGLGTDLTFTDSTSGVSRTLSLSGQTDISKISLVSDADLNITYRGSASNISANWTGLENNTSIDHIEVSDGGVVTVPDLFSSESSATSLLLLKKITGEGGFDISIGTDSWNSSIPDGWTSLQDVGLTVPIHLFANTPYLSVPDSGLATIQSKIADGYITDFTVKKGVQYIDFGNFADSVKTITNTNTFKLDQGSKLDLDYAPATWLLPSLSVQNMNDIVGSDLYQSWIADSNKDPFSNSNLTIQDGSSTIGNNLNQIQLFENRFKTKQINFSDENLPIIANDVATLKNTSSVFSTINGSYGLVVEDTWSNLNDLEKNEQASLVTIKPTDFNSSIPVIPVPANTEVDIDLSSLENVTKVVKTQNVDSATDTDITVTANASNYVLTLQGTTPDLVVIKGTTLTSLTDPSTDSSGKTFFASISASDALDYAANPSVDKVEVVVPADVTPITDENLKNLIQIARAGKLQDYVFQGEYYNGSIDPAITFGHIGVDGYSLSKVNNVVSGSDYSTNTPASVGIKLTSLPTSDATVIVSDDSVIDLDLTQLTDVVDITTSDVAEGVTITITLSDDSSYSLTLQGGSGFNSSNVWVYRPLSLETSTFNDDTLKANAALIVGAEEALSYAAGGYTVAVKDTADNLHAHLDDFIEINNAGKLQTIFESSNSPIDLDGMLSAYDLPLANVTDADTVKAGNLMFVAKKLTGNDTLSIEDTADNISNNWKYIAEFWTNDGNRLTSIKASGVNPIKIPVVNSDLSWSGDGSSIVLSNQSLVDKITQGHADLVFSDEYGIISKEQLLAFQNRISSDSTVIKGVEFDNTKSLTITGLSSLKNLSLFTNPNILKRHASLGKIDLNLTGTDNNVLNDVLSASEIDAISDSEIYKMLTTEFNVKSAGTLTISDSFEHIKNGSNVKKIAASFTNVQYQLTDSTPIVLQASELANAEQPAYQILNQTMANPTSLSFIIEGDATAFANLDLSSIQNKKIGTVTLKPTTLGNQNIITNGSKITVDLSAFAPNTTDFGVIEKRSNGSNVDLYVDNVKKFTLTNTSLVNVTVKNTVGSQDYVYTSSSDLTVPDNSLLIIFDTAQNISSNWDALKSKNASISKIKISGEDNLTIKSLATTDIALLSKITFDATNSTLNITGSNNWNDDLLTLPAMPTKINFDTMTVDLLTASDTRIGSIVADKVIFSVGTQQLAITDVTSILASKFYTKFKDKGSISTQVKINDTLENIIGNLDKIQQSEGLFNNLSIVIQDSNPDITVTTPDFVKFKDVLQKIGSSYSLTVDYSTGDITSNIDLGGMTKASSVSIVPVNAAAATDFANNFKFISYKGTSLKVDFSKLTTDVTLSATNLATTSFTANADSIIVSDNASGISNNWDTLESKFSQIKGITVSDGNKITVPDLFKIGGYYDAFWNWHSYVDGYTDKDHLNVGNNLNDVSEKLLEKVAAGTGVNLGIRVLGSYDYYTGNYSSDSNKLPSNYDNLAKFTTLNLHLVADSDRGNVTTTISSHDLLILQNAIKSESGIVKDFTLDASNVPDGSVFKITWDKPDFEYASLLTDSRVLNTNTGSLASKFQISFTSSETLTAPQVGSFMKSPIYSTINKMTADPLSSTPAIKSIADTADSIQTNLKDLSTFITDSPMLFGSTYDPVNKKSIPIDPSITITGNKNVLTVSSSNLVESASALKAIQGSYLLVITGAASDLDESTNTTKLDCLNLDTHPNIKIELKPTDLATDIMIDEKHSKSVISVDLTALSSSVAKTVTLHEPVPGVSGDPFKITATSADNSSHIITLPGKSVVKVYQPLDSVMNNTTGIATKIVDAYNAATPANMINIQGLSTKEFMDNFDTLTTMQRAGRLGDISISNGDFPKTAIFNLSTTNMDLLANGMKGLTHWNADTKTIANTFAQTKVNAIDVTDTLSKIQKNIDILQADNTKIRKIVLSDASSVSTENKLTVTSDQYFDDFNVLSKIATPHSVIVNAGKSKDFSELLFYDSIEYNGTLKTLDLGGNDVSVNYNFNGANSVIKLLHFEKGDALSFTDGTTPQEFTKIDASIDNQFGTLLYQTADYYYGSSGVFIVGVLANELSNNGAVLTLS